MNQLTEISYINMKNILVNKLPLCHLIEGDAYGTNAEKCA